MSSANVRIRGKIRHDEWPKIVERFENGESLAGIARSYRCTAPAIRYIVGRAARGRVPVSGKLATAVGQDNRRSITPSARGDERAPAVVAKLVPSNPAGNDIWGRINNDIATFLAAMDAVFVTDNDSNYETLLRATDRLLWACARTRLELERVIGGRKAAADRRLSG